MLVRMRTTPRQLSWILSLALAASACLALTASAMAASPKGSYKGASGQNKPVSLKVSGKKIKGFTIVYRAPCNDGRTLNGAFTFSAIDRKGRKFGVQGSNSGTVDGAPAVSNLTLVGKFNKAGTKATGTFSISTETINSSGDGIATCKSGKVRYTVKKK